MRGWVFRHRELSKGLQPVVLDLVFDDDEVRAFRLAVALGAEAPEPCARYQGCDAGYPVVMCQTEGKGHDRQDQLAMAAFWGLFGSL
jgi:hypothetical protein